MANVIGPNFYNELNAAGLGGLPFSWDTAGNFTYGVSITPAQKTAIAAVLAAHVPTKPDVSQAVTVNSTGTPALDGTYAIDAGSQVAISAIANTIANTGKFPGGGATMDYPDSSGDYHTFPSPAEFISFAAAISAYVAGWTLYRAGHIPAPPTGPITIA
jgi:hypothetical protein